MTVEDAGHKPHDSATWSEWVSGIVVANVVLIGLEYLVYRALAPLERGEPADAAVWVPIATVCELFGFGAAISVIPIFWFLLMSIIGWQTWARIKRERVQSSI